jgi:hypothetical protein
VAGEGKERDVGWVGSPDSGAVLRYGRKIVIGVVGATIIIFGLAIGFLPGPGPLVLVPLGLAVLGVEFAWARRLRRRMQHEAGRAIASARAKRGLRQRASRP